MLETLEPDTKADTTGKKRRNLAATDSCRNTEICIINDETPSSSSRKITTPVTKQSCPNGAAERGDYLEELMDKKSDVLNTVSPSLPTSHNATPNGAAESQATHHDVCGDEDTEKESGILDIVAPSSKNVTTPTSHNATPNGAAESQATHHDVCGDEDTETESEFLNTVSPSKNVNAPTATKTGICENQVQNTLDTASSPHPFPSLPENGHHNYTPSEDQDRRYAEQLQAEINKEEEEIHRNIYCLRSRRG